MSIYEADSLTITVRAKLWGSLNRAMVNLRKGRSTEITLPSGSTVANLITELGLPPQIASRVAILVNENAVPLSHVLEDGDLLDLFRPASGGSES